MPSTSSWLHACVFIFSRLSRLALFILRACRMPRRPLFTHTASDTRPRCQINHIAVTTVGGGDMGGEVRICPPVLIAPHPNPRRETANSGVELETHHNSRQAGRCCGERVWLAPTGGTQENAQGRICAPRAFESVIQLLHFSSQL